MTELYLIKDGADTWTRVFFDDAGSGFKLTRENPYFTQSESYTLDVLLPMDILQNRQFLGNLQRIDSSKQPPAMTCRLMVDNMPVLTGTARVTQVTERQVKVQLLGGNSEVNLKGAQLYIDEMDMGVSEVAPEPFQSQGYDNYNDAGVRFVCMQALNETTGETVNRKNVRWVSNQQGTTRYPITSHLTGGAPQPNLLDVLIKVIVRMGYTPGYLFPWQEPWKDLYVASAKITRHLAHALPHWTAKAFLDELCQLFNCTLKVDPVAKTISMESNISFFGNAQRRELSPCDEYTTEVASDNSEAQSLASDDIGYALSSSPAHDYDCLTDAVRDNAARLVYGSMAELTAAYAAMDAAERRKYLFKCPQVTCVDWRHTEEGASELVQVDMLAPLVRNEQGNGSMRELKIVPVAITEEVKGMFVWQVNGIANTYEIAFRSLALENPTGDEMSTDGEEERADIQDLITGEVEVEKNAEKEDLMQVFFVEDVMQKATAFIDDEEESRDFSALMPMTDYRYKVKGNGHRRWSLSLNPSDGDHCLGLLHQNGFSFDMKARNTFRFVADRMPDPRDIFIIRGKRYACEKIEASVKADGFDKLMTGYFYEML